MLKVLQNSNSRRAGAEWGTGRVVMVYEVLGTELRALGNGTRALGC